MIQATLWAGTKKAAGTAQKEGCRLKPYKTHKTQRRDGQEAAAAQKPQKIAAQHTHDTAKRRAGGGQKHTRQRKAVTGESGQKGSKHTKGKKATRNHWRTKRHCRSRGAMGGRVQGAHPGLSPVSAASGVLAPGDSRTHLTAA